MHKINFSAKIFIQGSEDFEIPFILLCQYPYEPDLEYLNNTIV